MREASGSTNIQETLHKAVKVLAKLNIPHFVCGGFAVQQHGYPRFTIDVDIIVPDVERARDILSMYGFKKNVGSNMTVTDRDTKVEIDVLPGGGKVGPGPLTIPMPTVVSSEPQILTLAQLISMKLSSYIGNPVRRAQDYADVVNLIQANRTPRALAVDEKVRDEYEKIWDSLNN